MLLATPLGGFRNRVLSGLRAERDAGSGDSALRHPEVGGRLPAPALHEKRRRFLRTIGVDRDGTGECGGPASRAEPERSPGFVAPEGIDPSPTVRRPPRNDHRAGIVLHPDLHTRDRDFHEPSNAPNTAFRSRILRGGGKWSNSSLVRCPNTQRRLQVTPENETTSRTPVRANTGDGCGRGLGDGSPGSIAIFRRKRAEAS